ncbi:MAG: hypothetical protein LBR87_09480 [Synergistaceae bacterium]|nr:hypothetical protein [Synergistaceae bacterium]
MEQAKFPGEERAERFIDSLEIVTSRLLEMTVVNSQLASSETREMRELFDTWIKSMSDEVLGFFEPGGEVSVDEIASSLGLSRASVLTLLVALDKRGGLRITKIAASGGDGKNSEICGCIL